MSAEAVGKEGLGGAASSSLHPPSSSPTASVLREFGVIHLRNALTVAEQATIFDMIAAERIPFLGYHMPFPALGYIEPLDQGYRFVPVSYQMMI